LIVVRTEPHADYYSLRVSCSAVSKEKGILEISGLSLSTAAHRRMCEVVPPQREEIKVHVSKDIGTELEDVARERGAEPVHTFK
jgi:hypothetical protein